MIVPQLQRPSSESSLLLNPFSRKRQEAHGELILYPPSASGFAISSLDSSLPSGRDDVRTYDFVAQLSDQQMRGLGVESILEHGTLLSTSAASIGAYLPVASSSFLDAFSTSSSFPLDQQGHNAYYEDTQHAPDDEHYIA